MSRSVVVLLHFLKALNTGDTIHALSASKCIFTALQCRGGSYQRNELPYDLLAVQGGYRTTQRQYSRAFGKRRLLKIEYPSYVNNADDITKALTEETSGSGILLNCQNGNMLYVALVSLHYAAERLRLLGLGTVVFRLLPYLTSLKRNPNKTRKFFYNILVTRVATLSDAVADSGASNPPPNPQQQQQQSLPNAGSARRLSSVAANAEAALAARPAVNATPSPSSTSSSIEFPNGADVPDELQPPDVASTSDGAAANAKPEASASDSHRSNQWRRRQGQGRATGPGSSPLRQQPNASRSNKLRGSKSISSTARRLGLQREAPNPEVQRLWSQSTAPQLNAHDAGSHRQLSEAIAASLLMYGTARVYTLQHRGMDRLVRALSLADQEALKVMAPSPPPPSSVSSSLEIGAFHHRGDAFIRLPCSLCPFYSGCAMRRGWRWQPLAGVHRLHWHSSLLFTTYQLLFFYRPLPEW